MPLIIPQNLPAFKALAKENVFVMSEKRAFSQDIRPLKIAIVNLMPTKIATEIQLARVLANSPLQVELTLIRMDSHEAKNVDNEHLISFYKTFDEIKNSKFDGMIITGAPVETLEFEDVDYWSELCEIMEYSKTNVYSTMHVCWGAQAGMYYHYKINKHTLDKKVFGVFPHKVLRSTNPLVRGFDEIFYAPHSRHTAINKEDISSNKKFRILAESAEVGPHIVTIEEGKQIFIFGHQEYDKETLKLEYDRDASKGMDNVDVPKNYFVDDNPKKDILFRWRSHANLLFSNWLNYYVYQETPFDLDEFKKNNK